MAVKGLPGVIALGAAALIAATPAAAEGDGAAATACDPLALAAGPLMGGGAGAARIAEGSSAPEPNTGAAYARALAAGDRPATRRARATGVVRIPVYIHVVQAAAGPSIVPESQINSQMTVLNNSFNGATGGDNTGFVFDLIDTDVTVNPSWVDLEPDTPAETAMKTALREGGVRALNLYLLDLGTFLGWATFPDEYAANPQMDGVVIEKDSVPGGSGAPYNLGDTAPHEVGHWLGLFHTFQGGCGPPGDFVDDTEPEATQHFGCPTINSCPGGGNDPVDNFMSYSDDICMFKFTPGQGNRAHDQTAEFRNGAPVGAPTQSISAGAGASVAVNVAATDPDGDALTYSVADPPDHGSVAGGGPDFTYTPTPGFGGPDSFTVQATDVYGKAATTQVNVAVTDKGVKLKTKAKKSQKLDKITVTGGCGPEGCSLTATGKIVATGPSNRAKRSKQSFKLKRAKAEATAGGQAKLKLKLSKGKQRKLERLLRQRGWKAKATVTVTAVDGAGHRAEDKAKFKVKR